VKEFFGAPKSTGTRWELTGYFTKLALASTVLEGHEKDTITGHGKSWKTGGNAV